MGLLLTAVLWGDTKLFLLIDHKPPAILFDITVLGETEDSFRNKVRRYGSNLPLVPAMVSDKSSNWSLVLGLSDEFDEFLFVDLAKVSDGVLQSRPEPFIKRALQKFISHSAFLSICESRQALSKVSAQLKEALGIGP